MDLPAAGDRTLTVRLVANLSGLRAGLGAGAAEIKAFGNTVGTSTGKAATGFQTLGRAATITGGLVAAGLGAALLAATSFEAKMRNVATIDRELADSESAFADAGAQVLDMSRQIGVSAGTLAEGLYDVASSGFQGAAGMEVLEQAAIAARAGLTTTATSAKAITAVLNAYGLAAVDAADVSDILFQTVNLGVVSFDELASGVGDWIGTAAAAKVSFAEASAGLAAMTLSGISAAESGTSLNRVLLAFIDPSEAMKGALQSIGYESGAAALQADGLQAVMTKLAKAGFEDIESMRALFPEVRGLRGALALAANEGDNFARVADGIVDPVARARATQKALEEQSKSLAFQIDELKAAISAWAIETGNMFIPAAKTAVGVLSDLFAGFSTVMSALGPMAPLVMGVAAAVTLAAGGFLLLAPRIHATTTALAEVTIAGVAANSVLLGLSVAAGGIGIALAAVSLAVGIFGREQRNAKQATDDFVAAMKAEQEGTEGAVDALVAKRIVENDLDLTAKQLGISTALVAAAIKGEAGAVDELNDAIQREINSRRGQDYDKLSDSYLAAKTAGDELAGSVNGLNGSFADAEDITGRTAVATDEARGAVAGAANAFGGFASAAEQAEAELEQFNDRIDHLLGMAFGVEAALDNVNEGMVNLGSEVLRNREEIGGAATSMSDLTEAGLRNRDMWRDLVGRVADVAREMRASTDAAGQRIYTDGQISDAVALQRQKLFELAEQLGFTQSDVAAYIGVLDQVMPAVQRASSGTIDVNTAPAERKVHGLIGLLDSVNRYLSELQGAAAAAAYGPGEMGTMAQLNAIMPKPPAMPVPTPRIPSFSGGGGGGGGESDAERDARELREQQEKNRAQMELERASLQDRVKILDQRITAEVAAGREYSDEWMRLVGERERTLDEIERVEKEHYEGARTYLEAMHQQELDMHRERYEQGSITSRQMINILKEEHERLVDLHGYWSSEARAARDEIRSIEAEEERKAEQRREQRRREKEEQQRAQDERLSALNDLLDEERSIRQRMAEAQAQHLERLAELDRQYNDDLRSVLDDRRDSLLGWADVAERVRVGWGNTVSALTANIHSQMSVFREWQEQLTAAKGRGLSQAVIDVLGLDEGPQALGQLRMFAFATEAEIADLNKAVEDRAAQVGDQVAKEQTDSASEVGRQLVKLAAQHAAEVERMTEEFLANQRALRDELEQLGKDQGRSYALAIADGLNSELETVRAAARALQEAMTGKPAAGGSSTPVVGASKYDKNPYTLTARSYDVGGYLPVGWSLAYNGTGAPEPVGHHLAGGSTTVEVNAVLEIDGQRIPVNVKAVEQVVRDQRAKASTAATVVGSR